MNEKYFFEVKVIRYDNGVIVFNYKRSPLDTCFLEAATNEKYKNELIQISSLFSDVA
jgi:hypothetical protein